MSGETKPFQNLYAGVLRDLSAEVSEANGAQAPNYHRILSIVGQECASNVVHAITNMMKDGWSTAQLATLLVSIADAQEAASRPEAYLDIVLSGPEIAGVPTRNTAAVISSIVSKAEREVLLVGYAVYNGKKLFEPIARRMEELPGIDVKFILNIPRSRHDTSLKDGILQRFMADFYKKNWPWEARPTVYYDPRALELEWTQRASLHAKCVVVDREVALVTSANFTEAAQTKNVETGVIVTYRPFARRIADYFDGLISTHLKRLP